MTMKMPKPTLKYDAADLVRGEVERRRKPLPPRPEVAAARQVRAAYRELARALTEAGLEPAPIRLLAAVDALRSLRLDVPRPLATPATAAEAAVARLDRLRARVLAAVEVDRRLSGPGGVAARSANWRPGPGEGALAELREAARLDAGGPDFVERLDPDVAVAAAQRDFVVATARVLLRLIAVPTR